MVLRKINLTKEVAKKILLIAHRSFIWITLGFLSYICKEEIYPLSESIYKQLLLNYNANEIIRIQNEELRNKLTSFMKNDSIAIRIIYDHINLSQENEKFLQKEIDWNTQAINDINKTITLIQSRR